MRVLKLTLAYEGTAFAGWQRQAGLRTVQEVVEAALAEIEGRHVAVAGAGRTDAGVHALGQIASARIRGPHAPDIYQRALNAKLPVDVRVLAAAEASPAFHARFTPSIKVYRYTIWNSRVPPLVARHLVWHVPFDLDLAVMRSAAADIVGTHDFAAFRARGSHVKSSSRTIFTSEITVASVTPGWPLGGAEAPLPVRLLTYEVSGNGFLRQMVRTLAGTLVEVARSHGPADRMRRLLAGGVRGEAGQTAPAQGLALAEVRYADRVGSAG
jgi:tRNA pseudouridine38-40 synthase